MGYKRVIRDKKEHGKRKSNPVARHLRTFNRSTVERDRKRDAQQGYRKHKGQGYE